MLGQLSGGFHRMGRKCSDIHKNAIKTDIGIIVAKLDSKWVYTG